jgi:putative ABC transport system ATP-binding protein
MIEIRHVHKSFDAPGGAIPVLRDFSLAVQSGEFVAVCGPSGCGKSTLLLTAGGLLRPDAGQVIIGGNDIYALSTGARAGFRARGIGFVFQRFHLVPYLSVLENTMTPALAVKLPDARERARLLLEQFGLSHRADHVPAKLSTGERQRLALARALLARPTLLLADEPTGNLDSDNAAVILSHFADFARSGGTVLLVTHDRDAARRAHRIVEMKALN